ncbi:hypothetical protein KY285_016771 [Solanum tuberosum]|nr:hypothetical protein KY285_016771 [Solanum tuberosum]
MKCDHCNMKGHLKDNCYQLVGYSANFKGKKRVNMGTGSDEDGLEISIGTVESPQGQRTTFFTRDQYHQIIKMLNKTSINKASAHLAGATNHITGAEGLL